MLAGLFAALSHRYEIENLVAEGDRWSPDSRRT
jgi:hypothetical protein